MLQVNVFASLPFYLYTLIKSYLVNSLTTTECPKIYRKSVLHLLKGRYLNLPPPVKLHKLGSVLQQTINISFTENSYNRDRYNISWILVNQKQGQI